jgi:hypothetical protein
MNMSVNGCEVAMTTTLVELTIHIYVNFLGIPASMNCPFSHGFNGTCEYLIYHSAHNPFIITYSNLASDQDSVRIFQQCVSIYREGDVCKPMDFTTSAGFFFNGLDKVTGWELMLIGDAAQAIQVSDYPHCYQLQAANATSICTAGGY